MIKAETAERPAKEPGPTTVDELEEAVKRANDNERLIGLLAAPLAGMVGLLVTGSLLANDPKSYSSVYHVLSLTLLVLALAHAGGGLVPQAAYLGVAMALYGLSIFNLHFWGFGIPFLLFGSWYLVRAYRLQQKLKVAREAARVVGAVTPPSRRRPLHAPGQGSSRQVPEAPVETPSRLPLSLLALPGPTRTARSPPAALIPRRTCGGMPPPVHTLVTQA